MKRSVLLFGTFDGLHPGHRDLFLQARKQGEHLVVILARDATVAKVKGKEPECDEDERRQQLLASELVDEVILGNLGDKYAAIRVIRPDVICLGYDQHAFVEGLEKWLVKNELDIPIVRLAPFKQDMYKSSLLRKK